jgi:hypothetical protein
MARWMLLACALTIACASTPDPVPVVGSSGDVSALVGEWSGEYDGGSTGRSGSIVFVLRSAADTAHGDVMMVPRASGGAAGNVQGRPGPLQLRASQVLSIAFVRVAGGALSGTLAPYTDPECNCTVQTTFTGTLRGSTIEGTFVTRGAGREQSGRWSVARR